MQTWQAFGHPDDRRPPVNFGPDIVAGDVVAASHLLAVRAAVDAFAQHEWPSEAATPPMPLAQGQPIRAAHINELRDRLRALQGGASERWFYHLDALGSVRVVTGPTGGLVRRHEYGPFGEDLAPWAGADQRRFTGKERDPETGLDYFSARYYGAGIGRFTTVDPVMDVEKNVLDPQRWNRYANSLNNPLTFIDPTGRDPVRLMLALIAKSQSLKTAAIEMVKRKEGLLGSLTGTLLQNLNSDDPFADGSVSLEEISSKIGSGHADRDHVLGQGDLTRVNDGVVMSPRELSQLVLNTVEKAHRAGNVRVNGMKVYYFDPARGILVVVDITHPDLGTVFVPDDGTAYFERQGTVPWIYREGGGE